MTDANESAGALDVVKETILDAPTEGQKPAATPAPEPAKEAASAPELSAEDQAKADAEKAAKDDEAQRRKQTAKERIQQLAREKNAERARADRLEKERDAALARLPNVPPESNVAAQLADSRASEASERAETASNEMWQTAIEAERDRLPDFEAVAYAPNVPYSDAMVQLVREHSHGPDIAYHLGKNPDIARRIANMPPLQAAAEIGKLSVQFENAATPPAPKRRETQAPPPIKTINGAGGATGASKTPSEMSMDEFAAWAEKRGW